jgi:hypothetical protein
VSAKNADVRIMSASNPQLLGLDTRYLHRRQQRCEQQWHNNNNNNNNNNSSSTVGCSVSKLTTMKHFALHDRRPRKRNGTQEQQETATPAAAQQAVGAATGKANDALRCSIARCHTPQRDSS